jgi:hypothetical protein
MNTVQNIISKVMSHFGFRHKYQVAEYFGVSPQALSTWLTTGKIPSRHILKVRSEIQETVIPEPQDSSIEENKTVIDYLINENVRLKNKVLKLNAKIHNLQSHQTEDDLFERINSRSLILVGRLSDGVITEASGNWYESMGYLENDLINHKYEDGFIHPDDQVKIKNNQMNILKSTGIKESRFSTIRRWKHGKKGNYVMLSMVWYINVEKDQVEIIAKPIDTDLDSNYLKN